MDQQAIGYSKADYQKTLFYVLSAERRGAKMAKEFDAKKFLKKLYELSGNEEGAKVVVKEIKEKEDMAAEAKEKAAV